MADDAPKIDTTLPTPTEDKEIRTTIDAIEEVVSEPPAAPTFHDITDASVFPPLFQLPFWLILIIIGALLVLLAFFLLRKKKDAPLFSPNYYNAAKKKLAPIKERLHEQPLGQSASDLSIVLREALKKSTQSPALYQTQNEFLSQDALKISNTDLAKETTDHLNQLWSLEYAPPAQDPKKAEQLVQQTDSLLSKLAQR